MKLTLVLSPLLLAARALAAPVPDEGTAPLTIEQSQAPPALAERGSFNIIVWKEANFGQDCGYPAQQYVLPTWSNVCCEYLSRPSLSFFIVGQGAPRSETTNSLSSACWDYFWGLHPQTPGPPSLPLSLLSIPHTAHSRTPCC
jgi:hypothetical protein